VGPVACRLDRYLAAGRYTVHVRGLDGAGLAGRARFAFSEVTALSDGPGPQELLAGGRTRTFSFAVPDRRAVGVGIRASREALRCELVAADGTVVRHGLQQFVPLEPGTYLLRVTALAGGEPVRFTPVLAGLAPPGLGPPEDYVREFLNKLEVPGTDAEEGN
jgi:hypothetical protein